MCLRGELTGWTLEVVPDGVAAVRKPRPPGLPMTRCCVITPDLPRADALMWHVGRSPKGSWFPRAAGLDVPAASAALGQMLLCAGGVSSWES